MMFLKTYTAISTQILAIAASVALRASPAIVFIAHAACSPPATGGNGVVHDWIPPGKVYMEVEELVTQRPPNSTYRYHHFVVWPRVGLVEPTTLEPKRVYGDLYLDCDSGRDFPSPDGSYVATCEHTFNRSLLGRWYDEVSLRDTRTRRLVATWSFDDVTGVAWTPDSSAVLISARRYQSSLETTLLQFFIHLIPHNAIYLDVGAVNGQLAEILIAPSVYGGSSRMSAWVPE